MKSRITYFYSYFSAHRGQWLLKSALMLLFFSGGLLLLSEQTLQELRLYSWVDAHRTLLALIVLLMSSGILSKLAVIAIKLTSERMTSISRQQKAKARLEMLDNDERALLREFFLRRTSSLSLPPQHPVVQRLVDSHVLVADNIMPPEADAISMAYCISAEARPYITSKRLRLPVNQLTEDDIRYLKATRPSFMQANIGRNRAA